MHRVNKRLVSSACAVALCCFSSLVLAVAGWTDYGSVTELRPTSNGRYLVVLNVDENPSGCKNDETFYQDYGFPGSKQMFDTLLEAVVAGKKVRVYVTGKCELNGYAEISSVGIVP